MKPDINQVFTSLLERYTALVERSIIAHLKKARDKNFMLEEIKKSISFRDKTNKDQTAEEKIAEEFLDYYKRGEDINDIVDKLRNTFEKIINHPPVIEIFNKKGKLISTEIIQEHEALKALTSDERKLLKYLIQVAACQDIQKRLEDIYQKAVSSAITPNQKAHEICWTGSKEENKNEFVQLVYALHKAGYINKSKGGITHIVEAFAEMLSVSLGKNWQSNHSASIHKSKRDYQPPVFDHIKQAYLTYMEEQVEEKRKKK